jgi:hypothetical protein
MSQRSAVAALLGLSALVCALLLPGAASAAAPALPGIATSIQEPAFSNPADSDAAFQHAKDAGATWVRLDLEWDELTPDTAQRPPGFVPADPGDPNYEWSGADAVVRQAAKYGLRPFISIHDAPPWVERPAGGARGTNNPPAQELADLFAAIARRYSGTYAGLPRVTAFEVWNEVNASFFFMPQKDGNGKPISPDLYRNMVNAVSAAVHAVHPDNLVIAGGLFPFFIDRPAAQSIAPLRFMRQFLCMSKKLKPKANCGPPVAFDVWSHHPYTEGSPTHPTGSPDSVSISGLQRMGNLLRAAIRYGRVQSNSPTQFWVSEWAWDSNPPDPQGVPQPLLARWVSEALYRMWSAGVDLASWFFLRDGAGATARFQSGLYTRCGDGAACDQPKLTLQAFRFPFVAIRHKRYVRVWGRVPPSSTTTRVVLERSRKGQWVRAGSVAVSPGGVFTRRIRRAKRGRYRARIPGGEVSRGFSLKVPPDFRVSPPVG